MAIVYQRQQNGKYAARGGENYKYAGSNDLDEVGWFSGNSGEKDAWCRSKEIEWLWVV